MIKLFIKYQYKCDKITQLIILRENNVVWIYTLLWLGLPVLAILNAVIREKVYKNTLGELTSHQVSSITLMILLGVYTWLFNLVWQLESDGQALIIGLIWLLLTVAFEFVFGHFVMKHSWARLFHDYNILEGRVWLLVLVWTLLAPLAVYRLLS